jgi:hypothetical protein
MTISTLYIIAVRRLHFLLLLATMAPTFSYITILSMSAPEATSAQTRFLPLYLLTLTFALPAALMYVIQDKTRNLVLFLLGAFPLCAASLALIFALEDALGISLMGAERIPQFLILLLYLLDAIRMRTNDNSRLKARAQEDHSWTGDAYLLPLPAFPILIAFAAIYIGALFLHSNALAQVALTGAILYFFLILPYHMLVGKDKFLESRHHLERIPKERIHTLQRAALFKVLVPCAIIALTAVMTSGGRHFLDLPTLRLTYVPDPIESVKPSQNALLRELMEMGLVGEGAPPPRWLVTLIDFVENALTVLMTAILLYGTWRIIKSVYLRFRPEYEESLRAASVTRTQDEHVSLKKKKESRSSENRTGSIRRRYRRTILRSLGVPPDIYETPSMMEKRANLPDTPDMKKLHEDYELARYGSSRK